MITDPWAWQCRKCGAFVDERNTVIGEDRVRRHYDSLTRMWCGPVESVSLRSER